MPGADLCFEITVCIFERLVLVFVPSLGVLADDREVRPALGAAYFVALFFDQLVAVDHRLVVFHLVQGVDFLLVVLFECPAVVTIHLDATVADGGDEELCATPFNLQEGSLPTEQISQSDLAMTVEPPLSSEKTTLFAPSLS